MAFALPALAQISPWGRLRGKVDSGEDASVLFLGDSTSASDEGLARAACAALFAGVRQRVVYETLDFETGRWADPVEIKPGSGVVRFRNASIGGGTLDAFTGRLRSSIAGSYDLIVLNVGHNYNSEAGLPQIGFSSDDAYLRVDESVEELLRILPATPMVAILQNPSRSALPSMQDERAAIAWRRIAARRGGIGLADVRDVYEQAQRPAGWYLDDIHPSGEGITPSAAAIRREFRSAALGSPPAPRRRLVCISAPHFDEWNVLRNGRFERGFFRGAPISWRKAGPGRCDEERADVPFLSRRAVRLQDECYLAQDVSGRALDRIRGKEVVVLALLKVEGGDEGSDAGILQINGGIGGANFNGVVEKPGVKRAWQRHRFPHANGAYAWKFAAERIPADAKLVSVVLWGSEAPAAGRYALWGAVAMVTREHFERMKAA